MSNDAIFVRLFGGTGNQLFQYATGRALADRLECTLVLDARYVATSHDRGDCFSHFGHARFERDRILPPAKTDRPLAYALWRGLGLSPRIFRERGLAYDLRLRDLHPGRYLHGYWQSERYFVLIEDRLRQDLAFTTPLDSANRAMADHIAEARNPVALHVRRGDYVAGSTYAAMTPDYYRAALEHIAYNLGEDLTCFVFSNDPDWVRSTLDIGHPMTVVDINDEATGHFDMHLQSICDHNVIANSTFSWWGAWLNANPDKMVVAPSRWFADPGLANPDLVPQGWIRF
ncbi:MAG: alpha-1,2-fucosyltransferase [Pseudomonadota bacterium]